LPPSVSPPSTSVSPSAPPPHLPTPFTPVDKDEVDLGLPGPVQLFASQFLATAMGMPFEVGKTLLQIEYRPRKQFQPAVETAEPQQQRDWGAEDDALSNPDEADIYFSDRLEQTSGSFVPPPPPAADESGYLSDRE
jgi:fusion and transport protein UGO1